jgi:hypothetical protein
MAFVVQKVVDPCRKHYNNKIYHYKRLMSFFIDLQIYELQTSLINSNKM